MEEQDEDMEENLEQSLEVTNELQEHLVKHEEDEEEEEEANPEVPAEETPLSCSSIEAFVDPKKSEMEGIPKLVQENEHILERNHPQRPLGVVLATPMASMGVAEPPHGPWGWLDHPKAHEVVQRPNRQ
jgi:hypothetical protein